MWISNRDVKSCGGSVSASTRMLPVLLFGSQVAYVDSIESVLGFSPTPDLLWMVFQGGGGVLFVVGSGDQ